jgi:hypothetical protein
MFGVDLDSSSITLGMSIAPEQKTTIPIFINVAEMIKYTKNGYVIGFSSIFPNTNFVLFHLF